MALIDVNLNSEVNRSKLEWTDVCYSIHDSRTILSNVSGNCKDGELLAIMGPTGCGKSSLCDVLCGRVCKKASDAKLSGKVEFNGDFVFKDFDAALRYRESIAYVQQEDQLFLFLTIRETLILSAYFHFPLSKAKIEIIDAVDFTIRELGLLKCQNTLIGNLSGGERKRVSVGKQIVANPDIILVDEPTSGLDSFQALNVMEILKKLSRSGKIVIVVVHQPRSSIMQLFDKLLLLSEGNTVYFGAANEVVYHFQSIGHSCPPQYNPADYLLDLISVDTRTDEREQESKAIISNAMSYYKTTSSREVKEEDNIEGDALVSSRSMDSAHQDDENLWINMSVCNANASTLFHTRRSVGQKSYMHSVQKWWRDLSLLSWRATVQIYRNVTALSIRATTQLFFAIIVSLIYNLTPTQAGIQNRQGLLFFVTINQAFTALQGPINSFTEEKKIVSNERLSMSYSLSAYFISRVLSDLPITIISLLIYSIVIYWGSGLRPDPERFFLFIGFLVLVTFNGGALGYFLSSMCSNSIVANSLGTPVLIILLLFGGFYVNSSTLPPGSEWIPYINFLSWGYRGLILNEFQGLAFNCIPDMVNSTSCENSGDVVIQNFGFSEFDMGTCAWASTVIYVGCLMLAYLGLSITAAERTFLKMKLKTSASDVANDEKL